MTAETTPATTTAVSAAEKEIGEQLARLEQVADAVVMAGGIQAAEVVLGARQTIRALVATIKRLEQRLAELEAPKVAAATRAKGVKRR